MKVNNNSNSKTFQDIPKYSKIFQLSKLKDVFTSLIMSLICEFCETELANKLSLAHHKKTAKYCLKIQIESGVEVSKIRYECEDCEYKTNVTIDFSRHKDTCKQRGKSAEQKVISLEMEVAVLKAKLEFEKSGKERAEKEAFKPKTINNNLTNNMVYNYLTNCLDPIEEMLMRISGIITGEYDKKRLLQGAAGCSDFINKKLLRDETGKQYYASVPSQNGKSDFYCKENGQVRLDPDGNLIQTRILPQIVDKVDQLVAHESKVYSNFTDDDSIKHLKVYKKAKKEVDRLVSRPDPLLRDISKRNSISRSQIKEDPEADRKDVLRPTTDETIEILKQRVSSWTDSEAQNYL